MSNMLVTVAGWLYLLLLAIAPWALACQPPWAARVLVGGIGGVAVVRIAAVASATHRLRVPLVVLILSACLLGFGWFSVARSDSVASATHTPPAALATTVRSEMVFVTAMLIAGCLAADLARDVRWRRRAVQTLVYTTAAIALVGVVGHLGSANPYGRFMSSQEGEAPFGPFNYQANAGAFLNLALPLALLAGGAGVVPAIAAAAIVVGFAVNASKAAQAVALLEWVACGIVWWRTRPRDRSPRALPRPLVIGLVLIGVTVAAVGSRQAAHRWSKIANAVQADSSRPILWRICWHMAESAGWRGYGPGTFKLLFPHAPAMEPSLYYKYIVREYVPGQPVSMWSHVHDDYLQSLIEWGWPGTALWVALFAGGLLTVARAARRSPVDRRCAVAVAIALGGVLLHALIDFPLQVEVIRFDVAALLGLAWSADEWSGTRRMATGPA